MYNKGGDVLPGSIPLPNLGRESHTYLTHIVERYDTLADRTAFFQGSEPTAGYLGHRSGGGHMVEGASVDQYLEATEPIFSIFSGSLMLRDNTYYHRYRTDYTTLGYLAEPAETAPDMCPTAPMYWREWESMDWFQDFLTEKVGRPYSPLEYFHDYLAADVPTDGVLYFSQGAQFSVSREAIHTHPKEYYEQLLSLLDSVDPWSGYFNEWLWYYIFLPSGPSTGVCPDAPLSGTKTAFNAKTSSCPDITIDNSNVTAISQEVGRTLVVACDDGFSSSDGPVFRMPCESWYGWYGAQFSNVLTCDPVTTSDSWDTETDTVPSDTVPSDTVPSDTVSTEVMISAEIVFGGLTEETFTDDVKQSMIEVMAVACGVDSSTVDILSYVFVPLTSKLANSTSSSNFNLNVEFGILVTSSGSVTADVVASSVVESLESDTFSEDFANAAEDAALVAEVVAVTSVSTEIVSVDSTDSDSTDSWLDPAFVSTPALLMTLVLACTPLF